MSEADNFFWEIPYLGIDEEEEEEDENCIQISNTNIAVAATNTNNNDSNGGDAATNKEEEVAAAASLPKGRKRRGEVNNRAEKGEECDEHEMHIWTERERRKKMRNMFASLHALLPHLPPKADKTTIVDEAVNHIKKLQQSLEDLEKQKLRRLDGQPAMRSMMVQSREAFLADQWSPATTLQIAGGQFPAVFKTWTSPHVILSLCGHDAHFSLCSVRKPGLLTAVCFVMEKHKLEVVSVQASSDFNRCLFMLHARANFGRERFLQAFPVEAIYKQAAAEIMLWINS